MLNPTVQVHHIDGVLVAEFWDCLRLDTQPVHELGKQIKAHLERQGRPDVVVDLNGVSFAGSASLGAFLTLHRQLKAQGGRLIFCQVDPTVQEVFRISRLQSLFDFVPDRAAALALAVSEPPPAGSSPAGESKQPPEPTPRAKSGNLAPIQRKRRHLS